MNATEGNLLKDERYRRSPRITLTYLCLWTASLQSVPLMAQASRTAESNRQAEQIQVVVRPDCPFIERRREQQYVSFDLLVINHGPKAYTLVGIKVSIFGANGDLEVQREFNENGKPPALDMVGERTLKPEAMIDIFQPFSSFGPEVDLKRMHLTFLFMEEGHVAPPVVIAADATVSVDVRPRSYVPSAYCLPLHGLVLVHDGHDFYSHHRRYSLVERYRADPRSAVSANLYAYDFTRVTEDGLLFRGDPNRKENWFSYGEPIWSPAEGTVVETVSDVPDNTFTSEGVAQLPTGANVQDPMGLGNHVKILHSDGRVSWLLHMQPNSIPVMVGDRVHAGALVGKIGFSGDSLFPHLHYNVTDSSSYPTQGVPSYFRNFVQILGRRRIDILSGQIDSGDLVEGQVGPCK